MRFKKGQSGNPNGRPKGAKNKSALLYDVMVDLIICGQFEKLKRELDSLHGKDYVDAMIKLGRIVHKNNNSSQANEALSDVLTELIKSKWRKRYENTEAS
jgi:hypothetical protein